MVMRRRDRAYAIQLIIDSSDDVREAHCRQPAVHTLDRRFQQPHAGITVPYV